MRRARVLLTSAALGREEALRQHNGRGVSGNGGCAGTVPGGYIVGLPGGQTGAPHTIAPRYRDWRRFAEETTPLRWLIDLRCCRPDKASEVEVTDLALSVRLLVPLRRNNVRTVSELLQCSPSDLMSVQGFGLRMLAELVESLESDPSAAAPGSQPGGTVAAASQAPCENHAAPGPVHSLARELACGADWLALADQIPVQELGLTVRARNCVMKRGVRTVGELARWSREELMCIRNFGRTSLADVIRRLEEFDPGVVLAQTTATDGPAPKALAAELGLPARWLSAAETMPLDRLGLSLRALNCMARSGIQTIGQLVCLNRANLLAIPNLGQASVDNIVGRLQCFDPLVPARTKEAVADRPPDPDWSSFQLLVSSYLRRLGIDERDTTIAIRRLGLDGLKPAKLRELAELFGVTSQTIVNRQAAVSTKARRSSNVQVLSPWTTALGCRLDECGGTVAAWCAALTLAARFGWTDASGCAVMGLVELFSDLQVDRKLKLIRHASTDGQACRKCVHRARELLAAHGGEIHLLDFAKHVLEWSGNGQAGIAGLSEEIGRHFSTVSSDLVLERDRLYLRDRWEVVCGGSLRAVTRACLARLGKPVHYRELAQQIRKASRRSARCSDGQVHGCLTDMPDCITVGRGCYALEEWGLSAHKTHAEVVIELLERAGKPLTRSGIIAALSRQGYSQYNLTGAIDQHPRIVEIGGGLVDLRERVERQELARTSDDLVIVLEDGTACEVPAGASADSRAPAASSAAPVRGEPPDLRRLRNLIFGRMHSSYRPVLFLALLDCADSRGTADLDQAALRFAEFYRRKITAGLPPKKQDRAIARVSSQPLDLKRVKQVIWRNPLRLFLESGLFEELGGRIAFSGDLWRTGKTDAIRRLAEDVRAQVENYFEENVSE